MKHFDSNHSFKETLFGILFLCTIIGAVFAIYYIADGYFSVPDNVLWLFGSNVLAWRAQNH